MKNKNVIYWILVSGALVTGAIRAISLHFMTDDAFISFRYAKNLVKGLGLVYNAGERVEGFTNFLWTIIIALGMKFDLDPVTWSALLSIFFSLATLLLYGVVTWKLFGDSQEHSVILPLTTIALSLHHDVNVYATGGLETAMFTFLVSAGFAVMLLSATERGLPGAGLLFVLAMMTRPDGIVFLAAAAIYILLTQKRPLKSSLWFLAPSVVIFLPYWLWRFHYYGYFFPNSFYAKSIGLPYYGQGVQYTLLYFKTYYVFALIIILCLAFLWQLRATAAPAAFIPALREKLGAIRATRHPLLLASLLSAAYTLFIVRIGGDFMFARFFIPMTPFLYFLIEGLLHLTTKTPVKTVLACAVILATFFRIDHFRDKPVLDYIADEGRYYSEDHLKRAQENGAMLHKYFGELPVKVGFWAGQVKLIYYADPAVAIETTTGLTDTVIAHQEIAARGRPGHEKNAPASYLVKRKVNFYIGPSDAPPEGPLPVNAIVFDKILARVIVYEDSLMSQFLRYPEVKFVRVPEYLDSYIGSFGTYTRDQVRNDYNFLNSFYFIPNNDTARQNAFLRFLNESPHEALQR